MTKPPSSKGGEGEGEGPAGHKPIEPSHHDHMSVEKQLQRFKQRDLRKVKIYKIASAFWGAPVNRKRVIVAPPMSQATGENRSEASQAKRDSSAFNSDLKPQVKKDDVKSAETLAEQEEQDRLVKHNKWISERKSFRKSLNSMGLSESWLNNKLNKTALENRVLHKMVEERTPRPQKVQPVYELPLEPVLPDESPHVKRPSPIAVGIIEKFLYENKMRLIDLFAWVDKDKNWKVSRDEFRVAIQKAQIPISEVLLEDLILTLDTDLNDELDYRELAMGMGLWRVEKRETKRKNFSASRFSAPTQPISDSPDTSLSHTNASLSGKLFMADSAPSPANQEDSFILPAVTRSSPCRIKSALSTISSTSSHYLEPPPSDLRLEQMVLSPEAMVDLRKRDKEVLARIKSKKMARTKDGKQRRENSNLSEVKNVIKTGVKAVDDHSMPSTIGGDTGELVDKFRQLKLKEYHQVVKLCKDSNVPLTEELLAKVLLFPPDKPPSQLRHSLRQPAMPLMSAHLADPPKRPRTPLQEKHKDSVKVTKSGKLLIDSRRTYPNRQDLSGATRMTLSTGKAIVRSQVDCWMTFEEYERHTRHLAVRFTQMHGRVDQNAFWPGHLLNKLRLCMPDADPLHSSVFKIVKPEKKSNPGYNNDLRTWPTNKAGYIQCGLVDPYNNKHI